MTLLLVLDQLLYRLIRISTAPGVEGSNLVPVGTRGSMKSKKCTNLVRRRHHQRRVSRKSGRLQNEDDGVLIPCSIDHLPPSPASSTRILAPLSPSRSGWEALPPYDEVVDGVKTLWTSFFQVGKWSMVLIS
jgi:hypothetical protein